MRAAAFIDHVTATVADYAASRAPGVRVKYHPNYHGAFVLDPDGNNVEAVCHEVPQ